MRILARKLLCHALIVALLAASGCTNIRPIDPTDEETYSYSVEVGEKIRLTLLDETVYELTVTEVFEGGVKGRYDNGRLYEFAWADVYHVERVTFAPMKTVGATLGVIVIIPIMAAGALLYGFACAEGGC